jgi:hypothetical protein
MSATVGSAATPAQAVLAQAAVVAECPHCALTWYRHEPIAEFDGRTACEMVAQGQATAVLAFLQAIARGERG